MFFPRQVPELATGAKFRTLTKRQQGGLDDGGSRRSNGGSSRNGGSRRGGGSSGRRALDEMTTLTGAGGGGTSSDMDRWLERVFDQALDGTVDELDDERTLSGRLKGGGDNRNLSQNKANILHTILLHTAHYSMMCRLPLALKPELVASQTNHVK